MPGSIGSQAFSYTVFALKSGLADLVDVAGQVDHLVGEAPLVRVRLRRSRRKCCEKALIPQGFLCPPAPAAELDQAICYFRCPKRKATFYRQNCIIEVLKMQEKLSKRELYAEITNFSVILFCH